MAVSPADLLVSGAGEVVTCAGPPPRCGSRASDCGAIAGGAVAALRGRIVAVGAEGDVRAAIELVPGATLIDAAGGLVAPGFVDAHTHPIFAGFREDEFNRILAGASYQEIAAGGGGILSTVRATRAASDLELQELAQGRLDLMLLHGTTTAEAKSGYGLSLHEEIRALEAIRRLGERHPLRLVPTLLAAHTTAPEYLGRSGEWIDRVIAEIIPAARGLARFCDVFCDDTAFSVDQARRVLEAGKRAGLGPRIHADEFASSGGAELAAEIGAISADHLGGMNESAIEALALAGVTAVLLPGTLYFLGRRAYAPARKLIDGGVALALGTDLNPGTSYTESMPTIIGLACLMMRMTIDEALVAATLNAAHSLGLAGEIGSLEVGKVADLVIYRVPNRFHLVYHYGVNHVRDVIARGLRVVEEGRRMAPAGTAAVL